MMLSQPGRRDRASLTTGLKRPLACMCDITVPSIYSTCTFCTSPTCLLCGWCTAYRRGWDPGWTEPNMLDQPLPHLLQRLRDDHLWLCTENERFYDDPGSSVSDDEFGWMLAVWDDLEVAVRHVHEYKSCIWGQDRACPADAPVRCSACVPIGIGVARLITPDGTDSIA
mgnify:FL=1